MFGGKQIPNLMRNLGKGATEFKRGLKEPDRGPEPEPDDEPEDSAGESAEKEGGRYDDDNYE